MTNKEIQYIKRDLPGILATLATILDLSTGKDKWRVSPKQREKNIKSVIETLMWLHGNSKLILKQIYEIKRIRKNC